MTRRDDNHKTATIIKGLEERLADLEEKDRTIGTPNVLRTQRDRVSVGDHIQNVTETELTDLVWNDVEGAHKGYGADYGSSYGTHEVGYGMTGYGETGYGERASRPEVGYDYGEGGYAQGGYGGIVESVWTLPADSGWGTGMWGSYE